MFEDKRKLIVGRLLRELKEVSSIALGPGIPQDVIPYLADTIKWYDLTRADEIISPVDLVVVEALEVSEKGDMALPEDIKVNGLEAGRWIVAAPILRGDGITRIVKKCQLPVQKKGCVDLVLTELGVIEISEVGFELRELSPGAASDEVRMNVQASLHVADGIQGLKI
jgi:3-oxoacid CoA-transferase subunit B